MSLKFILNIFGKVALLLCMFTALSSQLCRAQNDIVLNTQLTSGGIYTANSSITLANGFLANGANGSFLFRIAPPPLLNCIFLNSTPSANQNYIFTYTPRVAITDHTSLPNKQVCEVMQSLQYFDGLGRPLQTVQVKASHDATKDLIQPVSYDEYGRETIKYLPYADGAGTSGSYRSNALTPGSGQSSFYTSGTPGVVQTNTPFAQTVFEPSPLNRVLEQGAPGDAFQPTGANAHTQKISYGANAANEVQFYTAEIVNTSGQEYKRRLVNNGYYSAGELYLTVTKDENWTSADGKAGTVEEYKDKLGNIVLKRMFNLNTLVNPNVLETISTYYIYDYQNNLSFVLPPGANADGGSVNQMALDNFCYQYRYDGRGRVIEKKIPGKGWDCLVYDVKDQLVLSQDSVQRNNSQWLFSKYDIYGRLIINGLFSSSDNRSSLQGAVSSQYYFLEGSDNTSPIGYSNNSFPTTNITQYLTVNYYDNYSFPGASGLAATTAVSSDTQTQLTGSRVYKTDGSASYLTVNYYNSDARLSESVTQNHLGGTDRIVNTYSFTGELLTTNRTHTATSKPTITIANTYVYDHMGRKRQSKESINGAAEVILSQTDYSDIGQPLTKKLHSTDNGNSFLNTATYSYNTRGWLKNYNNPLFNMTLKYEDGPSPQYNGNISQQLWGTHNYAYAYDKLNRLTSGTSDEGFNEVLSYDLMGNILSLKRDALTPNVYIYNNSNQLTGITGNLNGSYIYDGNGNTKTDGIKQVSIDYNYLNLPQTITQIGTSNQMHNTWLANGVKLQKLAGSITRDYIGGIQYNNGSIEFIQTEEGRAIYSGGSNYTYEYMIKDHLGNTRILLAQNGNIRETSDYYPFGMQVNRAGTTIPSPENRYKYNGKELQTEFDLNQYDYGARFYDQVIARWTSVDPLAKEFDNLSPYNYAVNNPVLMVDPTGMAADSTNVIKPNPIKLDEVIVIAKKHIGAFFSGLWDSYHSMGVSPNGPGSAIDDKGYDIKGGINQTINVIRNGSSTERTYLAGSYFLGLLTEGPKNFSVFSFVSPKILKQMARRGWTQQLIHETVNSPYTTRVAANRATGNPSIAYFTKEGAYVVKDMVTNEVIQISNRLDKNWVPDATIQNPYKR